MSGRIAGALVALFGVGLLAAVLFNSGPESAASFSRRDGYLLILGTGLCVGGIFFIARGRGNSVAATTPPPEALARATMSRPALRDKADAGRRVPAEFATLVCAILFAVALGIGSGLWINTRWAASASVSPPSSAQSTYGVRPSEQTPPSHASEDHPGDADDPASSAAAATPSPGSDESSPAGTPRTGLVRTEGNGGVEVRAAEVDTSTAAGVGTSTSVARAESRPAQTSEAPGGAQSVAVKVTAGRGQGRVVPCTLSTSVSSLTIRQGGAGAVTLSLVGPNGPARGNAATPDWSDIAVFSESQTAGAGGSLKYSIRSVSKRPGLYRVNFTTPCGSKSIPVTVTR